MKAIASILFWLMMAMGGAGLAAGLVIPAWVEYRAALAQFHQQTALHAAVEAQNRAIERQIDALKYDPAYVERIGRTELGIPAPPGVETLLIENAAPDESGVMLDPAHTGAHAELFPELSAFVEDVLTKYPTARVFVVPQTRLQIMILSGLLIVGGVVLLGWPVTRQPRRDEVSA